jgi:hypothetical protein
MHSLVHHPLSDRMSHPGPRRLKGSEDISAIGKLGHWVTIRVSGTAAVAAADFCGSQSAAESYSASIEKEFLLAAVRFNG